MDGILPDQAIRTAISAGDIFIDPFKPTRVNPASVDLTLGSEVAVYERWVEPYPYRGGAEDGRYFTALEHELSAAEEPKVHRFEIGPTGWLLKPGILYLMHTAERVRTTKFVPVLDGKSSIGRLGITVHVTAGYGDAGFDGQYTLEVLAQHPVRVFAGMRFCQIRFHTIAGEVGDTYDKTGHYTGDYARGAVPSQAWKQIKENR